MDGMRTRRTLLATGLIVVAMTVVLVGCGMRTEQSDPPTTGPTSSLVSPLTGQTDTVWGPIWDALPSDFPIYPGAAPSDEAATGAASATLVVAGAKAQDVAKWTHEHLEPRGYLVDGWDKALEDGSYVIAVTGSADCRIQVAVVPLGGLVLLNILYGASCPNT